MLEAEGKESLYPLICYGAGKERDWIWSSEGEGKICT